MLFEVITAIKYTEAIDHLYVDIWKGRKIKEEALRAEVAKRLGQASISDFRWGTLRDLRHVEEALNVGSHGVEEVVDAARSLETYFELMEGVAPSGSRRREERHISEGRVREYSAFEARDYELYRTTALGEYLSLMGSLHPHVQQFRRDVLHDSLLTSRQARDLIDSPANARFSPDHLVERGVPIVGHCAEFLDHGVIHNQDNEDNFVEYEYIGVDPPGDILRTVLPVSVAYDDLIQAKFPAEVKRKKIGTREYDVVTGDRFTHVPIYPGSVLDMLGRCSIELSEDFCGAWDEAQAAWFILTGFPIPPRAMQVHYSSASSEHLTYGTITLQIASWVPADTVAAFYKHAQADMLFQKLRAPSSRNIAVFRFVTRELKDRLSDVGSLAEKEEPERTLWPHLMEGWNNACHPGSGWTYRYPSKFERDYYRGGRALLDPYDTFAFTLPTEKISIP